ncbi:MAG: dihydrofolate reductase [Corallococcus sp.]|nr:dihydrofolate reductase [Corallococcus sp.]
MKQIVVADSKWGIGKNNGLLFRLKKDMQFFRETTVGKVVVMGANTFYSFPNGALPDRVNIVLDSDGKKHDGTVSVACLEELDEVLSQYDTDDVFVIGGASVYRLLLYRCDEVYVTKVNADGGAELFYPNLDADDSFEQASRSEPITDNGYEITFCKYVNKTLRGVNN